VYVWEQATKAGYVIIAVVLCVACGVLGVRWRTDRYVSVLMQARNLTFVHEIYTNNPGHWFIAKNKHGSLDLVQVDKTTLKVWDTVKPAYLADLSTSCAARSDSCLILAQYLGPTAS